LPNDKNEELDTVSETLQNWHDS